MKAKFYSIIIIILLITVNVLGQSQYQTFPLAGFKVKCSCEFYENTTFIKMAKKQGADNIVAAYVCAENEESSSRGVINNINVYDVSSYYIGLGQSGYAQLEKQYFDDYANGLKSSGIGFKLITYQGVKAIEYNFDPGMPTKAIMFLKNKKSYLIQVGTRSNLESKFNQLKSSFTLL